MVARLKETYNSILNDFIYVENDLVEVTDLEGFSNNYAVYRKLPDGKENTLDWIPKNIVQLI